jgi:hypothetical protein
MGAAAAYRWEDGLPGFRLYRLMKNCFERARLEAAPYMRQKSMAALEAAEKVTTRIRACLQSHDILYTLFSPHPLHFRASEARAGR